MKGGGSETSLLAEIGTALEPIGEAAEAATRGDEEPLRQVLAGMGLYEDDLGDAWDPVFARVEQLGDAWATVDSVVLQPIARDEVPDIGRIPEAFEAIGDVFAVLGSLDDIRIPSAALENLGERIVDYLLITYLRDEHVLVYAALALLGVIRDEGPSTVGDLDLSRLGPTLANPNLAMQDGFEWGTQSFEPYLVVFYLKGVVQGLGLDATFEPVTDWMRSNVQELGPDESWPGLEDDGDREGSGSGDGRDREVVAAGSAEELTDDRMVVDVLSIGGEVGQADVDVSVLPVPGKHGDLPGLAVVPSGFGQGAVEEELDGGWTFNAEFSAEANWALRVRPGGTDMVPSQGVDEDLHGEADLTYDPGGGGDPPGAGSGVSAPTGTGVVVDYFQIAATIDYDGDTVVFDVQVPIRGRFVPDPPGGFVGEVLPESDGEPFDLDLGWSSDGGLYLERGRTLEATIPMRGSLGPATLDRLSFDLDSPDGANVGAGGGGDGGTAGGPSGPDSGGAGGDGVEGQISFTTSLSGSVEFGPITARFERMGVTAQQGQESEDPSDVSIGFEFPDGIGISIDTDGISGGGFLEYDGASERYAGVVQVSFEEFTINATGLLTTELPDGSEGFSLLLVLNADDLGIQLGAGFSLEGVGGMIGVNRMAKQRRIGNAVQEDSIGRLFFPENPAANADRLVSDLGRYFPPRRGHHIVGPVARLSWLGMFSGQAGVVFEFPTAKLTLVGTIGGGLPDEDSDLVRLNMAFSGSLDLPNGRIALDASLYDSKVIGFTLQGDMALRASWGDESRFLLSIGGWHPRYDPPGGFPELDRVGAVLGSPGGNPRLELKGYLAVTSNTFQVGAKLLALAEAGPARVKGHLSFDALFQFSPFKFVVDFSASVSVTVKGRGLTISLDGTLSGPGPFRVDGTITISVFFIELSASVNLTIGPSKGREQLPRARILPELREELDRPGNWTAERTPEATNWATLRNVDTDEDRVVAHPLSRIGVRQQVVPLDFEIEKFRDARPSGYTQFEIETVTVGGASVTFDETLEEEFAPSKFTELSDEQKMNSPAFEYHAAGRTMQYDGLYPGFEGGSQREENVRTTEFGYECTVIDRPRDNWGVPLGELGRFAQSDGPDPVTGLTEAQVQALTSVGAVASSPARKSASDRFHLDDAQQAAVDARDAGTVLETTLGSETGDEDAAADGGRQQVVRGGPTPDVGGLAGSVTMSDPSYAVVDAETMGRVRPEDPDEDLTKTQAQHSLARLRESHPELAKRLQVVEAHRARAPPTGGERA